MRNKLRRILTLILIAQLIISIFSIKSLASIETDTENLYATNFNSVYNTYKSYIGDSENDETDEKDSINENVSNNFNYDENESEEYTSNLATFFRGYSSNGYFINSYDVKIDANEDNTYNITETIEAFFESSRNKHGIIRKIPLKNTVRRQDGTSETNRANVSDISVNDSYTVSREDGECRIKIGSAENTVTGLKKYVIKYKYNIGNDKNKNFDELYLNIIGNNWDTSIRKITFTINMPKGFDSSKVGFSSGYYGKISADDESNNESNNEADDNGVVFNVTGNTITGYYLGFLEPSEGITLRIQLPQGYFVEQKLHITIFDLVSFILPIIFVVIAIILWNKYGKDDKPVETVEFYPPEGFNSLDVGYFYDGKVKNNHVISLLVYLANKGYIEIKEIEKSGLFTKKHTYQINKIKEYDGDNSTEKLFFEGLFDCGSNGIVKEEDLVDEFYKTIADVSKKEEKVHKTDLYTTQSSKKSTIVAFLFIINIFITVFCFGNYANENYFTFQEHTLDLIETIYNVTASVILFITLAVMPKRTEYGTEMLGKIKGFRNFLETAEKDKLEKLVKEDPKYFYNILPYTYALGVSKVWMDKFETMAIQTPPPTWYSGYDAFDMIRFNAFMNSTMKSATTAMTSTPSSSSSGGGYSGGGFSGGGSGGGGGSSW